MEIGTKVKYNGVNRTYLNKYVGEVVKFDSRSTDERTYATSTSALVRFTDSEGKTSLHEWIGLRALKEITDFRAQKEITESNYRYNETLTSLRKEKAGLEKTVDDLRIETNRVTSRLADLNKAIIALENI